MRNRHRTHALAATLTAFGFVSAAAFAADEEPRPFAAQADGYLGGAIFEYQGGGDDDEGGVTGGGTGSLVAMHYPLHLQLDVFGDTTHPETLTNVGFGGHVGLSDPERGAIAMTGAYSRLDLQFIGSRKQAGDFSRIGGEAELYAGPVTLGARGGVFDDDGTHFDDDYYVQGTLRFYPLPNLALEGTAGYANAGKNDVATARILAEFRPEGAPLSFFVRWEAGFIDDVSGSNVDFQQHAIVAGLRLIFDGGLTLQRSDRVYFRDRCIGLLQYGARTC